MKHIFITGIGRGYGLALTKAWVARGHHVFGLLRRAEDLQQFSDSELRELTPIIGDVREDAIREAIPRAVGDTAIDLLINNAGIPGRTYGLANTDLNEIEELLSVHCTGAMRVTQALLPNLLRSDAPAIVNVNSRLGSISAQQAGTFRHLETSYSYRIAKAAQNMFTACLHSEFGDRIRVSSITPGRLMTEISQSDADVRPEDAAGRFVEAWERDELPFAAGITEIGRETIPW